MAGALPQERLPRRGEGHPPGIAVKELDLQLLFQGRDQPAQGRLRHEQVVRRLRKIEPLCQDQKALDLFQVHPYTPRLLRCLLQYSRFFGGVMAFYVKSEWQLCFFRYRIAHC